MGDEYCAFCACTKGYPTNATNATNSKEIVLDTSIDSKNIWATSFLTYQVFLVLQAALGVEGTLVGHHCIAVLPLLVGPVVVNK